MRKAIVLLLSALGAVVTHADDVVEQRCREFLAHLPPVHLVATGTRIAFTGQFTPIPAQLTKELQQQFPDFTFRIANMTFVHWGPEPVHLLLVVDRVHNSVRSYLWDVWFTEEPFSFDTAFGQQGQPVDIAQARITALARLVCFQMGWTVGEVTVEDGVVFAPLINPDKQVWRVIRSRVTPSFPFESLAIVHPNDKLKTPPK